MKRFLVLCLIAAFAVVTTPALAQEDVESADTDETTTEVSSDGDADSEESWMSEVSPESGLLEFGFFLGLFMPSADHNLRDDAMEHQSFGSVAPEFGLRLAYFPMSWFGIEGETGFVTTSTEDDESASLLALRAHGILQLPGYRLTPFVLVGGGQLLSKSDSIGDDDDPSFHYGVGVKLATSRSLSIRLDVRDNISSVNPATREDNAGDAHHQEVLLGLTWTFGRTEPAPVILDSDGDGFMDPDDACVNEPGVAPDGCPIRDRDGDGIMDPDDKCVADPEDMDGFEDEDGCPEADNDQDGILDGADKCPNEAEDKDGFEDEDGCPDLDNDKDGFPDTEDDCPLKPGIGKWKGCPGQKKVVVVGDEIQIIDKVFFDTGKATIKKVSYPLLDEVAEVIKANPLVKKIEVQGHTDDQGGDKYNLKLSDDRAKSVMQYLIGKSVSARRLSAKGYGETAPLKAIKGLRGKALKTARTNNRRVQFKIIEQDRKTQEIEVGPDKD